MENNKQEELQEEVNENASEEVEETIEEAIEEANELIPVMDNMERAMDACTDKEDSMYKGLDMVQKQLKATFEKFGLEEIDAEGQEFDPNLHLAVMQEPVEGIDANQVVMVLQKGYKLKTKVLRPAMVKVSC